MFHYQDFPPPLSPGIEFMQSLLESTYVEMSNLRKKIRQMAAEAQHDAAVHKNVKWDLERSVAEKSRLLTQQGHEAHALQDSLNNVRENIEISIARIEKLETSEEWYREAWGLLLEENVGLKDYIEYREGRRSVYGDTLKNVSDN